MRTADFHRWRGLRHTFGAVAVLILFLLHSAPSPAASSTATEDQRLAFEKMGEVKEWPERPWSSGYSYSTRHYHVRTNTSPQTAQYVAQLMEQAAARYREIFSLRLTHIPRMPIHVYATREQYEVEARKYGLPSGVTGGFFLGQEGGGIHLPYVKTAGLHPSVTLFHEGTHQFVQQAIDFRVPLALWRAVPKDRHLLPSVPLWLGEGLATYVETARFDGDKVEVGYVNRPRLIYLKRLLRQRVSPSVREVLERRHRQPFGAEHYSVAWGIVYFLRHQQDMAARKESRQKLTEYIKSCKQGLMRLPVTDFRKQFMEGDALIKDFDVAWNVHVGEKSRSEFERLIVGRGQTLETWEKAWSAWIRTLHPDKPYGGTYAGEAAESGGDDALH